MPANARRSLLQKQYGFWCQCSDCQQAGPEAGWRDGFACQHCGHLSSLAQALGGEPDHSSQLQCSRWPPQGSTVHLQDVSKQGGVRIAQPHASLMRCLNHHCADVVQGCKL